MNNPIIFRLSLSNNTFSKIMVNYAAARLGPDLRPIATFHVTPVCDCDEETGAHKVILEGWCWMNSIWAGSKCKTPLAALENC